MRQKGTFVIDDSIRKMKGMIPDYLMKIDLNLLDSVRI